MSTPAPSFEIIKKGRLPIYSWATELEPGALAQAVNCANLPPAFHHIAVMADGHQGYGVPIGAVLALDEAVSPYAVGNDIGCGMALVATTLHRGQLVGPTPTQRTQRTQRGQTDRTGEAARDAIMSRVQASIPAGSDHHPSRDGHRERHDEQTLDRLLNEAFDAMEDASAECGVPLSTTQSTDAQRGKPLMRSEFLSRGRSQAGTLGSGNHFIELLAGPDDDVWVLVHSGSRGVGGLICANFHRMALTHCAARGHTLADPGLAWLPAPTAPELNHELEHEHDSWVAVGTCYARAMRAALEYAARNRSRMLEAIATIVEHWFPDAMRWDQTVNIHHNDAVLEEHFGRQVWVHRKGAVKATLGIPTVTPGSMGTGSVMGRGLGSPASFCSAAHGAGRSLSRGRARRELSLDQQLATVAAAGGKVFATSAEAVLDEMPGAYKDLDEVMIRQADLVEPVRRFTPLATYKGAEQPRGRRGRWRPGEER